MSAPPAAELRGVTVRSGDRLRLDVTDLSIRRGAVTAVVGRNGSGKSTLLGVIGGELRPSSGIALVDGDDVQHLSPVHRARKRALLTQETHVAFGFTVAEVVAWGRVPWRGTDAARRDEQAVSAAIAAQELDCLRSRPVRSLSGGERKRVHLARVTAQDTGLLLLDEADSDLDLVGRRVVDAVLVQHARAGRAAIVVSHDLTRVAQVCDDAVVMRAGRILAAGPSGRVLTEAVLSQAYDAPVLVTGAGADMTIRIA